MNFKNNNLQDIQLPNAPILVADNSGASQITTHGEIIRLDRGEAIRELNAHPQILCNKKITGKFLQTDILYCFDILELFVFIYPTRFIVPTHQGLAKTFSLRKPNSTEEATETLLKVTQLLLSKLLEECSNLYGLADIMKQAGWTWGPIVLHNLQNTKPNKGKTESIKNFKVWEMLTEWEEVEIPGDNNKVDIKKTDVLDKLEGLLGKNSEKRPEQKEFAISANKIFSSIKSSTGPTAVIAEAGTGVGKTLAYIAPAILWAERNNETVWISTHTKNLQRQLDNELDRLYKNSNDKSRNVVIRKGRENYLCLLNLEEAINQVTLRKDQTTINNAIIALSLISRWVMVSRNGDIKGGDFPTWLFDILEQQPENNLTDTQGECIYSACRHYNKCFIEKSVRKAATAKLVIANHALVISQSLIKTDNLPTPKHYIFDEGHHIFGVADNLFSIRLTGNQTSNLRYWILGAQSNQSSRARGLKIRIQDLVEDNAAGKKALSQILNGAHILPSTGWQERIVQELPLGPVEKVFVLIRQNLDLTNKITETNYDIEISPEMVDIKLITESKRLLVKLNTILEPAIDLIKIFKQKLNDEDDPPDLYSGQRIEAILRTLERQCVYQISMWKDMLECIGKKPSYGFIDLLALNRIQNRDFDIGLIRHLTDPTKQVCESILDSSDGILITSATLRDDQDWNMATMQTGLNHIKTIPTKIALASPFNYKKQARVYIVTDVDKNDTSEVAKAYKDLIIASGGGGLGLFTSIAKLKRVYRELMRMPQLNKLNIFAQHADNIDVGTLIDIFREDENSCLLGTDAVRDGIDVPGRSLRLLICDKVPWPRPNILHKARKVDFKNFNLGHNYDDILVRLKLKQAFGRLIRKNTDYGVFVMLDKAMPSRLKSAFPNDVNIQRLTLSETISETKNFLFKQKNNNIESFDVN